MTVHHFVEMIGTHIIKKMGIQHLYMDLIKDRGHIRLKNVFLVQRRNKRKIVIQKKI